MTKDFRIDAGGTLTGAIRVPGDKSISHRSIMLGAIADGTTQVTGFLEGEDALATMNAFRAMGVRIEGPAGGEVTVHGVGKHGLGNPSVPLDCGNSGTSMRLLSGLLSGAGIDCEMIGDESLSRRPMNRVALPLRQMGAVIETAENGRPPLRLKPSGGLKGIDYVLPMASAQVKSCLILAGLYAAGRTRVTEPEITRDHTERMLAAFGYPVERDGATVTVTAQGRLTATPVAVPADISSAAFFMVGASIAPGSDIVLSDVGVNPTRTGVIDILKLMGADIELTNRRNLAGEPVADVRVRHAPLHGIDIPEHLVPLAIDEFPVLFVAAANATGETRLSGAEELRVKESDRIQVMADGLAALGVSATPTPDGMIVRGGSYGGGTVESHGDHRIAMAFSMAALKAGGPIVARDCANVATSFPGFVALAARAGVKISER